MLEVLSFADKAVREKLFERVDRTGGLVLVTATRQGKFMKPVDDREPFATLEQRYGAFLHIFVALDEGTIEGMWRDPVGDLADALLPHDRNQAYLAASGYLVLKDRAVAAVVKKHGAARDDLWFLEDALARVDERVSPPSPAHRPGPKRRRTERAAPRQEEEVEPEPPALGPPGLDPWQRLGIAPGTSLAEAKKAFRALVAQYHPDKVAHLAPEFRQLAEERTRQILEAWEAIEAALRER